MHQYRKGFKAQAERIALELRQELRLRPDERLDPRALAEHLCIPVVTLHELADVAPKHVAQLLGPGSNEFSAATIYLTQHRRLIIVNPAHSSTRRVNSECHELSHILLEHEGEPPLGERGERAWNLAQEREADWLAGSLLVPREAAHKAAVAGHTPEKLARAFGVSPALARWRMNGTGGQIRARRLATMRVHPTK